MSKYIPGNQKQLTLEDRVYIENELAKGTGIPGIPCFCNIQGISAWCPEHPVRHRRKSCQLNIWRKSGRKRKCSRIRDL